MSSNRLQTPNNEKSTRVNPQKSFSSIAAFTALMNVFRPSFKKVLILIIIFIIIYSCLDYQTSFRVVLASLVYLSGAYLYSLNRLSSVVTDSEYLSHPVHDGFFPVRNGNGGVWETPGGFEEETYRLQKHYKERLIQFTLSSILYLVSVILTLVNL